MKYRHSKYKGCKMCKPHKAGWEPRFKAKEGAQRDTWKKQQRDEQ